MLTAPNVSAPTLPAFEAPPPRYVRRLTRDEVDALARIRASRALAQSQREYRQQHVLANLCSFRCRGLDFLRFKLNEGRGHRYTLAEVALTLHELRNLGRACYVPHHGWRRMGA